MARKMSRKDWYQYHKGQAEKAAANSAGAAERAELKRLEDELAALKSSLARLSLNKSGLGFFASLFSASDKKAFSDIESKIQIASAARDAAAMRLNQVVSAAARTAALNYGQEWLARKEDMLDAQAVRREKYLERAPGLRGEQQSLKASLLNEQSDLNAIACYYCGQSFHQSEIHIDHKTPIARGGTNERRNTVLCCKVCNLRKGTRTEYEYQRWLEKTDR